MNTDTDREEIVGHVPREHLKLFWKFIERGGSIVCKVDGQRRKGNGLKVPCLYCFFGTKKLMNELKRKLTSYTSLSCPF